MFSVTITTDQQPEIIADDQRTYEANKEGVDLARLNLKIPVDIKEYLTIAAAKASIEQKRNVSVTEYLCDLVRYDMEKQ